MLVKFVKLNAGNIALRMATFIVFAALVVYCYQYIAEILESTPAAIVVVVVLVTLGSIIIFNEVVDSFVQFKRNSASIEVGLVDEFTNKPYMKYIPKDMSHDAVLKVVWEVELSQCTSTENINIIVKEVKDKYRRLSLGQNVAKEVLIAHEAGHATVAIALGYPVLAIHLRRDGGETYVSSCPCAPEEIWDALLISVAGWAGERRADVTQTAIHQDEIESTDYANRLSYIEWSPTSEYMSPEQLIKYAKQEATRILNDYEDLYSSIAHELEQQGELTSESVIAIVRSNRTVIVG